MTRKEARRYRVRVLRDLQEAHRTAEGEEERAELAAIIGQQMRYRDIDLVRAHAREVVEQNADRRLRAALASLTAPSPSSTPR